MIDIRKKNEVVTLHCIYYKTKRHTNETFIETMDSSNYSDT